MTMDHEPASPPARSHPTIFMVALDRRSSILWEAGSEAYRAPHVVRWRTLARKFGKNTIEVWGRYGKLAEFQVKEEP